MPAVPRYQLLLRRPDGTEQTADFQSLTGRPYDVGDTIKVEREGTWRIVEERPAGPPYLSTLVCELE